MKSFVKSALVLLGLVVGGCEKYSGPTEVSGYVVDRHTRQPVAGAEVWVVGASSGWAGGSSSTGGTTTDALGRFALTFEASGNNQYQVGVASASGYSNQGNGPVLRPGRKNDNLVVNADAPAWVRINCVDDPPYGKVGLETWGYSYGLNGVGDSQNVGPGNFSFVRPALSYSTGTLLWRMVNAQAQVSEGKMPYTTAGFDTTTVTIHF